MDFGAPDKFGAHLFRVEIPASRNEPVLIIEDYGYRGLEGGIPRDEDRVVLPRVQSGPASPTSPAASSTTASRPPRFPTGRWHTGTNLVDRLLGKELCVLAWAAETANDDQTPVICSKWAALRREERWWLFSMTVAEAGLPEDTQRGWRRALFLALSDGEKPAQGRKRRRPVESDLFSLPLFKDSDMTDPVNTVCPQGRPSAHRAAPASAEAICRGVQGADGRERKDAHRPWHLLERAQATYTQ